MKLCFTTLTELISQFWIETVDSFAQDKFSVQSSLKCWNHFKNDWEYLFLVARNDRLSLLVP